MNTANPLMKYGPTLAVIATALYLGWPPAQPLDLGETTVRAKAVRWKKSDLQAPKRRDLTVVDPFREVLVARTIAPNQKPRLVASAQKGPSETDLRAGLLVGGIGTTANTRWVIINNHVCRVGESVAVSEMKDVRAVIASIESDHIIAEVSGMRLRIQRMDRRSREMRQKTKKLSVRETLPIDQEHSRAEDDEPSDVEFAPPPVPLDVAT